MEIQCSEKKMLAFIVWSKLTFLIAIFMETEEIILQA